MKKILVATALMFGSGTFSYSQTDTLTMVLDNYFDNIGGRDAMNAMEGYKMSASVDWGGMSIPVEQYRMKDGRRLTMYSFQGMEFKSDVFDGEVHWGTSQMTMKPEKSDSETTENAKRDVGGFPDPFLNMEDDGYKAEYLGMESVEGVDCYKVKLTKKPYLVDGEEQENVEYYFFDDENFVPVCMKSEITSGPMAGSMAVTSFSDYQEVDGIYFPFALTMGTEDSEGQSLEMTDIEINPDLEDDFFSFPEDDDEAEGAEE